jgi:hypothetical protein
MNTISIYSTNFSGLDILLDIVYCRKVIVFAVDLALPWFSGRMGKARAELIIGETFEQQHIYYQSTKSEYNTCTNIGLLLLTLCYY